MGKMGYRQHLRGVVAASAAPHGYTLTIWTAGAITTHAQRELPSAVDALLLLAGAALGFGIVGAYAFGSINGVLAPGTRADVRVWGGMHFPSVGLSIGLTTALTVMIHGPLLWLLVGFTATAMYLLVIGGQFWFATHRSRASAPIDPEEQADG